jgi:hypothetical protein
VISTYKHILRLLDDVLLCLPLEALDDVLALLGGALQTGGKLNGGVLRSLLDVLVAKSVAGKGHGSVEQTWE